MTTLVWVEVAKLPEVLPRIRALLGRMIERRPDWGSEEHYTGLLLNDYLQLHLALDDQCVPVAALLTEIKRAPNGKRFCCLVGVAGENRHTWPQGLAAREATDGPIPHHSHLLARHRMTYIPGAPRDSALFRVARHDMGGGSKTVQSVSSSEPPAIQTPYLTDVWGKAANQFNQGVGQGVFQGSRVVPLSGQTEQALGMQEQRALAGSPLLQQAQQNAGASLRGELNPALQAQMQHVMQQVKGQVNPLFAQANRGGSGAHANALTSAMTDAGTKLAYQDYNNAMQMAPGLAQQDYFDIGQLGAVGQTREQQAGAELQAQMQKFYEGQKAPVDALQRYAALVSGGNVGGTTTSQQPIYSNPLMSAAGLGLGGVSAAGSLFGSGGIWPGALKNIF
jgi:hypothetical protein